MAGNGNQQETIRCSRCKKRFFENGFKVDRLGRRLKTCLECNDRGKDEESSYILSGIEILAKHFSGTSQWTHRETLKTGERGAWYHCASSVANIRLNKRPEIMWLPSEAVKLLDFEPGTEAVNTYNTQTHFVLIIAVNISKKRAKQGEDNAIMRAYKVSKDAGDPANGCDKRYQGVSENLKTFNKRICFACQASVEKQMACERCRYAVYCGRECQVKDWPTHKRCCKMMRESKATSLEILDEASRAKPTPAKSLTLTDDDLAELLSFTL